MRCILAWMFEWDWPFAEVGGKGEYVWIADEIPVWGEGDVVRSSRTVLSSAPSLPVEGGPT